MAAGTGDPLHGKYFVLACYQNEIETVPQITGAEARGTKLFVYGENFDEGAKIFLNNDRQKTANEEQNPTKVLIGKKAGKRIVPGHSVMLQVKNRNGRRSSQFVFTSPVK